MILTHQNFVREMNENVYQVRIVARES